MPNLETMRTFVALPISDRAHQRLAGVQRKLKRTLPAGVIKWVKPAKIHLTLFFLGEVATTRLDPIQEALKVVARNSPPFTAEIGGLSAFPSPKRPSVLWVGMRDAAGQLALLHHAVNEALANVGFEPDHRSFTPHLTLGRVRRRTANRIRYQIGASLQELEVGILSQEKLSELVLFRSELRSSGAVYTRLATFELSQALANRSA